MPAFSHQFDQVDLVQPTVPPSLEDWALRAAHGAATMLQGCSEAQLTGWGRAVERELQLLAARHVGEPSRHATATDQVMSSPAEVRWHLTDLQLLGDIDLTAPSGDLWTQDPSSGAERPVQLWRLRAMLALWKIADANMLLTRGRSRAKAVPICAAEAYAGSFLPKRIPRKIATEVARTLVTEAAVAIALASESYRADMQEALSQWETVFAEERGVEQGEASQKLVEAEKRTSSAREAGKARQAETYRAQELIFKWLRKYSVGYFATPSGAATRAVELLNGKKPREDEPGLDASSLAPKETEWDEKVIRRWLTHVAPADLNSRWRKYSPRGKVGKAVGERKKAQLTR